MPSLELHPNSLRAGDSFDVTGSGFDSTQGDVVISFQGNNVGATIYDGGIIAYKRYALTGEKLRHGTYTVTASQQIYHHWVVVASAELTIE